MTFNEAINLAKDIIKRFEKIEGKPWGVEGSMMELSKQVGDLSKLVMSQENYYFKGRDEENSQYLATKEKIADELADILYAVIRIAEYYKIDLEEAHTKMMKETDDYLKSRGI